MSQGMLIGLLWAAAILSAALSFLAWALLARGPRSRKPEPPRSEGDLEEEAEVFGEETGDIAEERDDRDITT